MSLTMQEWVENALYDEMIASPLWLHSAFGNLKDGDKLKSSDVRIRLIASEMGKIMGKCPASYYDRTYHLNVRVTDGIAIIKKALKVTAKFNE